MLYGQFFGYLFGGSSAELLVKVIDLGCIRVWIKQSINQASLCDQSKDQIVPRVQHSENKTEKNSFESALRSNLWGSLSRTLK